MIQEIFTVLDQVAEQWLEPFFSPTTDAALRGFKEACNIETHSFAKHPEDYAMYKIGTFDGATGKIESHPPIKIAMATSFTNGFGNQLEMEA